MAYHARLNLIMLTTIVGLVIFLYIRPQSLEAQEYRISSLPAEAAQSIRILHKDTHMVLKKQENHWYLTEPINARADEKKVRQLLEILSAKSEHRFPLTDLDRFSLDKPNVKLSIDHESFGFGGLTPVTNQQYVATEESVFLISPRYAVMLPSQPVKIVSPALLAETEIPVSFELGDVSIKKHAEDWIINPENIEQPLSQEEINRWVELWQQAIASNLILDSEILHIDDATLAQKEIKISLQNGQKIKFNVLQHGAELFLMRSDEAIGYVFSGNVGKSLLDPYYISNEPILFED